MKRSMRTLIISLIVLALLGAGYFLALKWEPNKEKTQKDNNALITEELKLPEIEYLINIESDDVDKIVYKNTNTSYTIINGENPTIEGYESHLISKELLKTAINTVSVISSSKKFEVEEDKLQEYGLSEKKKTVTITLKDGSEKTIIFGNDANFGGESYAIVEGSNEVNTIPSYLVETIMSEPSAYRDLSVCIFDANSITEISVKKGTSDKLKIKLAESNEAESPYGLPAYTITYPYEKAPASPDKINALFEKLVSVTAEDVAEENPTDLSKYGFDDSYEVTIKDINKSHNIKIGDKTENGNVYIMYNDVPVVYIAPCEFYSELLTAEEIEFVERFIHLYNLDEIKNVSVTAGKKTNTLSVSGDVSEKTAEYKINGKKVDEEKFKGIYAECIIGILFSDVAESEPSGEKQSEFTFEFKDGTKKTFTYYKYDERYSIVKNMNGINVLTLTENIEGINDEITE